MKELIKNKIKLFLIVSAYSFEKHFDITHFRSRAESLSQVMRYFDSYSNICVISCQIR